MKLDVLAFGVHPDDVELSCGGVLLVEKKQGKKVIALQFVFKN